jgi:hypothetical protein
VKEAARLRLLALVDPALATLARAVRGKGKPTSVELRAAMEVLDRAGLDLTAVDSGPEQKHIIISYVGPDGEPIPSDARIGRNDGVQR